FFQPTASRPLSLPPSPRCSTGSNFFSRTSHRQRRSNSPGASLSNESVWAEPVRKGFAGVAIAWLRAKCSVRLVSQAATALRPSSRASARELKRAALNSRELQRGRLAIGDVERLSLL